MTRGATAPHRHDWEGEKPWRICVECYQLQHWNGKHWRKASRRMQEFVVFAVAFHTTALIVLNPELIEQVFSDLSRIIRMEMEEK